MKQLKWINLLLICIIYLAACQKKDLITSNPETANPNLYTVRLNGQDVQVLKKGALYYFYDDVIFDQETFDSLKSLKNTKTSPRSAYTTAYGNYWPNGIVYYKIPTNIFTTAEISLIQSAINHWQTTTSLSFIERTTQANYIGFEKITSGPLGASNSIGMKGGYQKIELFTTNSNYNIRTILHEIGHAVGLYHEQSRADRDNHLIINWDNIATDEGSRWQFKTYTAQGRSGADHGLFDWESIMLYGSYAGSINGYPTMVKSSNNTVFFADGTTLSAGDIASIANMYGQPPFVKLRHETNQETYNSYPDGSYSHYTTYNVYVDFYADRLCSIPFIPTSNTLVNLQFDGVDCDEYGCGSFGHKAEQKTLIPNGTNSFHITSEPWKSQESTVQEGGWMLTLIDEYYVNVMNFYNITN